MAQAKTRQVNLLAVLKSRAFALGVADRRAGLGFRGDLELIRLPHSGGAGGQWSYERGRMFAACCDLPIRHNRKVNSVAYRKLIELLRDGSII